MLYSMRLKVEEELDRLGNYRAYSVFRLGGPHCPSGEE